MMKPSRSRSNGRLAVLGSPGRVVTARMAQKAAKASFVIVDSLAPAIIAVASPRRMVSNASPMAWAPEAQADAIE